MASLPLIWVLADDRAGNTAQVLGVAEALDRPFEVKNIGYNPIAELPTALIGAGVFGLTPESRMILNPPWPDVVISAGRRTGPVARWIKRRAGKAVALAHLMYPGRMGAADFDLIVAPNHDGQLPNGTSDNVMRITGAPHRINLMRLELAVEQWKAVVGGIPRPFIALLVGGATHSRSFPAEQASELGRQVHRMAADVGGSVLLTTSRRTGAAAELELERGVPEPRSTFFWSRGGENPYMGFLALADAIVVTGDSVSMCSEACASPAPVYIYAPDEVTVPKHRRLHRELYGLGLAKPFDGRFDDWTHPPLNAATDVARAVEALIAGQSRATI
jgi:mitochondrial fission protein ELM1